MKKPRKKGAVIVEFLIVIPVFMLLVWGILQVILYMSASSLLQQAALESATAMSEQLRGDVGPTLSNQTVAKQIGREKLQIVTSLDSFIELFNDGSGALRDSSTLKEVYDDPNCGGQLTNNDTPAVICAFIANPSITETGQSSKLEAVYVRVKAPFKVLGTFGDVDASGNVIGHWQPFLFGNGANPKSLVGWTQYYKPDGTTGP